MKVRGYPTVTLDITIQLTEEEAGALGAMAGYGEDAFIKAFYEHLGRAYMEKYEAGLRSFLQTARELDGWIDRAEAARKTFCGAEVAGFKCECGERFYTAAAHNFHRARCSEAIEGIRRKDCK